MTKTFTKEEIDKLSGLEKEIALDEYHAFLEKKRVKAHKEYRKSINHHHWLKRKSKEGEHEQK